MAKLPRVHQKIFAENAITKEIGQFGSAVAGAKKETGDIAEIQALEAWKKGWSESTVSKNRYPAMQERNGIDKVITQQLAYMFQEGIPEWNAETEYSSTGLVKGLDGGDIKLYRSLQDNNTGHLISESDWWEEVSLGGAGMPIGTIFSHTCTASFVPENSLPCDGTEYAQTQFQKFYTDWLVGKKLNTCTYEEYQQEISTYGKCAKFGLDTENGKFKVPTIPDGTFIQQAMSDDELGKSYKAGLPNVTGVGGIVVTTGIDGCHYVTNELNKRDYGSGTSPSGTLNTDLSRFNPIYGNSNTVQPEAVALRFFVVVATKAINESEMDWSAWASSLASKLNADHSNDTKPYIVETYVNDKSGYITYSNGLHREWGFKASTSSLQSDVTITLLKSYKDLNYNIQQTLYSETNSNSYLSDVSAIPINENSFKIPRLNKQGTVNGVQWQTIGYIS